MTIAQAIDDLDVKTSETGREVIPNRQRGCGHLKPEKAYIRADVTGKDGVLPRFVTFDGPIPYKEGTLRSFEEFPGTNFELSVQGSHPTLPRDEISKHLDRLSGEQDHQDHYGEMVTAYANDLLMWVGGSYYETVEEFVKECRRDGLNKAIPVSKKSAPPAINPGRTKCYCVHPKAFAVYDPDADYNDFEETMRLAWNDPEKPPEDDVPPVEHVPGIIGYSYLTRVIWTAPRDGDVPAWAKQFEATGQLDIVDIGDEVERDDDWDDGIPAEVTREQVDEASGDSKAADADADGGPSRDDLPDDYNDLKAKAADVGADVSPQPSKDELERAILDAMDPYQ